MQSGGGGASARRRFVFERLQRRIVVRQLRAQRRSGRDQLPNGMSSMPHSDLATSEHARQLQIGLDDLAAGRLDAAVAAFQCGLAAALDLPPGEGRDKDVTELHFRLGNACMLRGDLDGAAANYKAALRLAPDLTSCWCNLGNVYLQNRKPQDAISIYLAGADAGSQALAFADQSGRGADRHAAIHHGARGLLLED